MTSIDAYVSDSEDSDVFSLDIGEHLFDNNDRGNSDRDELDFLSEAVMDSSMVSSW